ncbi:MAG: CIA30 family protein [Bacteroidota bacterium]
MKLLTLFFTISVLMVSSRIDFGVKNGNTTWRVVNDGVMGGLSTGKVNYSETSMTFSGAVSLENNGGFASIRSAYARRDLSDFKKIKIKYRSEGYDFGLSLNRDRRFWIPNYKQNLPQTDWQWKTAEFDLLEFKEYYVGRPTGAKINESLLSQIIQIGLITNEKRAGSFKIEVDYLEFI